MSEGARAWTARFADSPAVVRFVPADPDAHAALLNAWGHLDHVARWWELGDTVADTAAYLRHQRDLAHSDPWLASVDDRPTAYVETYRAAEDPLADHAPVGSGDMGWHVLVGPPEALGSGTPRLVGRAVLAHLLARGAARVVCEPDAANARMIRYCARLGFASVGLYDLPDKRADLLACDREAAARAWPAGIAALEVPA
ncbi:MAG: GNAT family N-acetyltransferase [Acidimicrobiia bacterium]